MSPYACAGVEAFEASRAMFEALVGDLAGSEAVTCASHAELEELLTTRGRELMRQLFQDHLDLRARHEQRLPEVTDAEQIVRASVESGHARALTTVFGQVTVDRLAYRRRGGGDLYPVDGQLNLPVEKHSHGLRRLVAVEAARGSFDDAGEAIERATGVRVGKRQVERACQVFCVS